jgi:hypothetical protein
MSAAHTSAGGCAVALIMRGRAVALISERSSNAAPIDRAFDIPDIFNLPNLLYFSETMPAGLDLERGSHSE